MQADYKTAALALASIVNYWDLTEGAVTSFADSKGSSTLTAASAPSTMTGPDGVATAAYINNVTNAVLTNGGSFTWPEDWSVAFWMNCDATMTGDLMAFEWNQSAFTKYVQLDAGNSGSNMAVNLDYGTGTATIWTAAKSSFGTASWKFVVITYKRSTDTYELFIDNSSVGSHSASHAQTAGAPGSGYLGIGGRNNAGTRGLAFDGALSGFALFQSVLTSQNRTDLKAAMAVIAKTASDTAAGTDGGATVAATTPIAASESAAGTDTAAMVVPVKSPVTVSRGDDFNHTTSSTLAGSTSTGTDSDGSAWSNDTAMNPNSAGRSLQITAAKRVRCTDATTEAADSFQTVGATMSTADYDVQVDVVNLGGTSGAPSGHYGGVLGRWVPGSGSPSYNSRGYAALLDPNTGDLSLVRYVPVAEGGGAIIASTTVSTGNHTLRMHFAGSVITVYVDEVLKLTFDDTDAKAISGAGKVGVRLRFNDASLLGTAASDSNGTHLDNFRAGLLALVNPSESATGTDTASVNYAAGTIPKTASESSAGTDTATVRANVGGGGSTGVLAASQSGSPTTITAGSGASDSLNYNSFPGLTRLKEAALSGSRVTVASPATSGKNFQGFPGYCITSAGTRLALMDVADTEASGADYGCQIRRSTDSGATFSTAKTFSLIGGDCSMYVAADGTIYALWINANPGTPPITVVGVYNNYWSKSTDDGVTWSTPAILDGGSVPIRDGSGVGSYTVAASPPLTAANNGKILLPIYRRSTTSSSDLDFYVECREYDADFANGALRGTPFPHIAGWRFEEPCLAYRADGKLVAHARTTEPGDIPSIWANVSTDHGVTWGTAQRVIGTGVSGATGFGGRANTILGADGLLYILLRVMVYSAGTYYSGTTAYATSYDGLIWSTPKDAITDGAIDTTHYLGSGGTEYSTYGQFANATAGVEVVYGTGTGGTGTVYRQAFISTNSLSLAYHHANDHTATTTGKLSAKRGATLASMSEIGTSPLRSVSGINLADVSSITLADGRIMVIWNESSTPAASNINTVVNFKWAFSSDGGRTFGSIGTAAVPGWATTVTAGSAGGAYAIAPCPPVQIPVGQTNAGDLLIATYGWDDRVALGGSGSFNSHEYVKLVRFSPDTPGTATVVSTIFPDTSGVAYDETALLYLDDGTLMAACRKITGGTGYDIVAKRSAPNSNGAAWGSESILLGTTSSTGYGGRPSLIQTANGGVLLRFRYMNAGSSSWTGYRLSSDRGVTFPGPDIDPYDGTQNRTGSVSGTGRGLDLYGAFALTGPNTVSYVWSEELGATSAVLYGRELTVSGGITLGAETSTTTDTASVTVGVGSVPKTASDAATETDTASVAKTIYKTAGDTAIATDSSGISGPPAAISYLIRDSYVVLSNPTSSVGLNDPTATVNIEIKTEVPN